MKTPKELLAELAKMDRTAIYEFAMKRSKEIREASLKETLHSKENE